MRILDYGAYQKSVDTNVVPFHALINIAIDNFTLKCILKVPPVGRHQGQGVGMWPGASGGEAGSTT